MRIARVFIEQALSANLELSLGRETAHYLTRVLRLSVHAKIVVFNGTGGEYTASITDINKNDICVTLGSLIPIDRSSPLSIHLGIGISRGERMDLIIQKATELGVAAISPLFSERCEVKLRGERLDKKVAHWRKVAISACEQCQLNLLPQINHPTTLAEWTQSTNAEIKLVLYPQADNSLTPSNTPTSVALLIGPEGGLSDIEIGEAIAANFQTLQLGQRILRTETAPITALSILQYQWGDLGSGFHSN